MEKETGKCRGSVSPRGRGIHGRGVLIVLENVGPGAELSALQAQSDAERAKIARLSAERDLKDVLVFPASLAKQRDGPRVAEMLEHESALFTARRRAFVEQSAMLHTELAQTRQEIAIGAQMVQTMSRSHAMAGRQRETNEALQREGFVAATKGNAGVLHAMRGAVGMTIGRSVWTRPAGLAKPARPLRSIRALVATMVLTLSPTLTNAFTGAHLDPNVIHARCPFTSTHARHGRSARHPARRRAPRRGCRIHRHPRCARPRACRRCRFAARRPAHAHQFDGWLRRARGRSGGRIGTAAGHADGVAARAGRTRRRAARGGHGGARVHRRDGPARRRCHRDAGNGERDRRRTRRVRSGPRRGRMDHAARRGHQEGLGDPARRHSAHAAGARPRGVGGMRGARRRAGRRGSPSSSPATNSRCPASR